MGEEVHKDLMDADSVGKKFYSTIKDKYKCEKIEEEKEELYNRFQ